MNSVNVSIALIGDQDEGFLPHQKTVSALTDAASALAVTIEISWIPTMTLETGVNQLTRFDGIWCVPGRPYKSLLGVLEGIRVARQRNTPFLSTCGGFQHAVLEYARNVLGLHEAQHEEYAPSASELLVSRLPCSLVGKRLVIQLLPGSLFHKYYRREEVEEEYCCNFGLNPRYRQLFDYNGLYTAGVDAEGKTRILELKDHRFFIATLFLPQLTSSGSNPHPLIVAFLKSAMLTAG